MGTTCQTATSFSTDSIQFRTPCSRHSQRLARELAAFDTRVPDTTEDMPIGAVGIDRLVATELTLNSVAETLGRNAGLLIQTNGCKYGHKALGTYACFEVGR